MGCHVCLGTKIAGMEGRLAIGKLLRRNSKIMCAGPAISKGFERFRGFNSMSTNIH